MVLVVERKLCFFSKNSNDLMGAYLSLAVHFRSVLFRSSVNGAYVCINFDRSAASEIKLT